MREMRLPLLVLARLASAATDFGFEWQQRILGLGLEENNATAGGCAQACQWLQQVIPENGILPSSTAYFKEKSFFWSAQQGAVSPACFVLPNDAEDVAVILHIAKQAECPFAVKSGGHGAFAGASSIEGGITIDLQLLNEVTVSEDKTITRVGPGNRWIDVYSYLDKKKLSVVGGRVAEIGVGGLTLGGGISYFSNRYGWALDGVRNYELVTASGEVLDVNYDSHPDLYWALRGGGNNFGVVTRFDMETFPQTGMWGGMIFHPFNMSAGAIDAFVKYVEDAPQDVDSHAYVAFVYAKQVGGFMIASMLTYARPVENPPIFENFLSLQSLQSTMRTTNATDLALELNSTSPNGLRNTYTTMTFLMSHEMTEKLLEIWKEEIETIEDVEGLVPALVLQMMPTSVISRFGKNGGNCLGIDVDEGPLLLINHAMMWAKTEDDETVHGVATRVLHRATEWAKEKGLNHRYLYQNYADIKQDVFAGYGEENLQKLREIGKKYDPDQVFQKLQPGYFKL